jgi:transcriptional regulator with XRE-family HTH domain
MGGHAAEVFGKLLRQWRRERQMSQERLAELSGCDRSYLSRLERGLNVPSLNVMVDLANALKLRPSEMLTAVGIELEAVPGANEQTN